MDREKLWYGRCDGVQLVDLVVVLSLVQMVILFSYAARQYLFSLVTWFSRRGGVSGEVSLDPSVDPFVSVMLPVYNEPNVVDRLLRACTSFDYPNYEVVVVDDSIDETTEKLGRWRSHPRVKVVRRGSRRGWKGGALNEGLDHLDPRSTHVLVLDADFVPPRDLLQRFLVRFDGEEVAAVQGSQSHDLNYEENWMTRAVRVFHSIYDLVELNARHRMRGFVSLTGSVAMIRTEVLRRLRFEEDITEDWNLSLRLYESGYKVVFDPTLRASGECPRTLARLFRQNMRWAEGGIRNFRRHLWRILTSDRVTVREKIDFLVSGGFYLNAIHVVVLMVVGVLLLPFAGYVLANPLARFTWLLMLVGMPSTTVEGLVALSLEGARRDFKHILNALLLGYIETPVIAYAALKGLLTNNGRFVRTYKTGRTTRPLSFS